MYQLPTSSMALAIQNCEICGQPSHGKHFGATSCRACAAFFRRWGVAESVRPCKKNKNCQALKTGWFNCKECRLAKCKKAGMETETFQFGRDSFFPRKQRSVIPETMSTFLGRCNLILFCAPKNGSHSKSVINVKYLLENADNILKESCDVPMFTGNSLEKLAIGIQKIRKTSSPQTQFVTKIGKEEFFSIWENQMLKVAEWLTYFDNFQLLPMTTKTEIHHAIWKVWCRLEKLCTTALGRRLSVCDKEAIMTFHKENRVVFELKKMEIDFSWLWNYTLEQLSFFSYDDSAQRTEEQIQTMIDLNPTDVEYSFMLCQLCLHHVGKRLHYLSEIAEKLQDEISNDLHEYYIHRLNNSHYSLRLAKMMKINNSIRNDIIRDRVKDDLMSLFDVFKVVLSHPEEFREL